jgi:hypothetical protein
VTPGVLLLDEPVNGLDTDGIRWIRQLMQRLAQEGRTVLVSSHLISEMALTAGQHMPDAAARAPGPPRADPQHRLESTHRPGPGVTPHRLSRPPQPGQASPPSTRRLSTPAASTSTVTNGASVHYCTALPTPPSVYPGGPSLFQDIVTVTVPTKKIKPTHTPGHRRHPQRRTHPVRRLL